MEAREVTLALYPKKAIIIWALEVCMRFILFFLCFFLSTTIFASSHRGIKHSRFGNDDAPRWSWFCSVCDKHFATQKKFHNHIYRKHRDYFFIYDACNSKDIALPPQDLEEKIIGLPAWVERVDPYARWWCTKHRVTFRDYDRFKDHLRFYHRPGD